MTSLASRLSRLNRGTLNKTQSQPCLSEPFPPRSFLESMADAIKAPASLFYKENKQSAESQEVDSCQSNQKQSHNASPKKSVRFRPGNSVIESKSSSLPIDIPEAHTSLPPGQLETTPIQQCFKTVLSDPVPTARPPEPQIMKSSAAFREAIATTDPAAILKDFEKSEGTQTLLCGFPLSPAEPKDTPDNPFEDPFDVADLEITRNILHEHDPSFQDRTPPPYPSDFNAAEKGIQDITDSASDEGKSPRVLRIWSEMPTFSHIDYAQDALPSSGQTSPSYSPRHVDSSRQSCNSNERLLGSLDGTLPKPQGLVSSQPGDINKWRRRPTHEDIRKRFRQSTSCSSVQSDEEASTPEPASHSIDPDCLEVAVSSVPSNVVEPRCPSDTIDVVPAPEGALELSRATLDKQIQGHGVQPQDLGLAISTIAQGTWTAELALRGNSKPCDQGDYTPVTMSSQGMASQQKSHFTGSACRVTKDPVSGSPSATSRPSVPRFARQENLQRTPSPSFIPLPLSSQPAARILQAPYSDQHGWSPFEEHEFIFAALAFIQGSDKDFRQLICQPSGFWQFWNWCDLPQETAPCQNTRGLVLWEIDELLNTINEQNQAPRSICTQMVEDFKSRIRLAFVRKHRPLGEPTPLFASIPAHRPEETGETFDDCTTTEGGTPLLEHDEYPFYLSLNDVSEPVTGVNSSLMNLDLAGLAGSSTNIGVLTEEEKIAKASKVLESFGSHGKSHVTKTARLGGKGSTPFTPEAESKSRSHSPLQSTDRESTKDWSNRTRTTTGESKWSFTSKLAQGGSDKSNTTTCSTPPSEVMEEDEKICRGLV
ncbi:hypothetical protein A1O3_09283 [Capronia epimyces CBS 606.96]|uniref:Uncharacterized protein n=1 Tax=Capronia epimyces CBS 606.96 TaxID=1182542 RepID=W9XCA4_9EURO|nr:uncharacterized protein A1O3_09283 [Capronia epimyces CBS 606.96]EXJ78122.1 hypothetical protein A1O3_09283 [Capronia epimyces CBS 606.96]